MQAITDALGVRVRPAALLLAGMIVLALTCAESAAASTAYSAASARPRPIASAGWDGRPVRHPHQRVGETLLTRAAFPAGWSSGAVGYGTGYHRLGGSERVREVQRRLTGLGYNTGPVDGLYGPLTRSAVQWFQIKHGLRPTGVVAAATLAALRDPKGFARQPHAQAKQPAVRSGQPSSPVAIRQPRAARAIESKGVPEWLVPALIAAFITALAMALTMVRRRAAGHPQPSTPPSAVPAGAAGPQPAPEPEAPVLGYVPAESEPEGEEAITVACRERGWTLGRLIRDGSPTSGRTTARPGLKYALEQLGEGGASRLVVHRLEHVARSLADLRALLTWFMRAGVALTVLDVGFDTGTAEGRTAMRTLLSVCRSHQARVTAQTSTGLAAARAARRPAVEDSPELAGRIREMRAAGMTLQAIADTLNEEEVPTIRGGAEWRPSSVQSVLGYRRTGTRMP